MRGFKVSRDPLFVEKVEDIVGLYMSPPEHALVLCCDEKSQVQAPDRTQPGLPLKKGRAQTMTHGYKRHGTTTLFAAINVLDGQVIGQCQQRQTHAEWLKFLRKIDRETPKGKTLHLIADNCATHKHPAVQQRLAKHPRFNMHFTPTSASWLNMVERFCRDLTTERVRRGVFTSVPDEVELLEAREDAAVALETAEEVLDLVAALVHGAVALPGFDTRAHWWHDRDEARVERELAGFIALVGTIHDQVQRAIRWAQAAEKRSAFGRIARLAR